MNGFGWRSAAKIAWREARSSPTKFLFVILAVSAGVAALTGVRGFSTAFHDMLMREARTLMAADLTVRIFGAPDERQIAAMERLSGRGVRRTRITETVSMMTSEAADNPVLVSVKAVDPRVYPFYGQVTVDPPAPLAEVLSDVTIAVSDDLPLRLSAEVGDTVRLGGQEYRIAAILRMEPDRMSGSLNVGPRVMMTRGGLERTGLMRVGSRASQRFLFRMPDKGVTIEEARNSLRRVFPNAQIIDYRETHPNITRALSRATTFLSLVSLIALIVGALGVATAMHSHLQQRLDTIAIMKCIGARSGQIIRIYTLQTLMLGAAGGVLGIVFGLGVQKAFPWLIARYFEAPPGLGVSFSSAFQGLATGILVTLLFTLPPLLGIRSVRPGLIFRREMAEARPTLRERWRRYRASLATGVLIFAGAGVIAVWLSGSVRVGAWFLGGLVSSLVILSAIAWLLLRGLRIFVLHGPVRLPATLRHGLANLYRPGNHAGAVLVALGVGVMFTLTVFLIQRSVIGQVLGSAPPDAPNVFMINVTDLEHDGIVELLREQKDIQGSAALTPSISARLTAVDGIPSEKIEAQGFQRRFLATRSITWTDAKPDHARVLQGAWWSEEEADPVVSVVDEAARALHIRPGSVLEWNVMGQNVQARVAAIHRNEQIRFGAAQEFILNRAALEGFPMIYVAGLRMRPAAVPALQRLVYERFPTVTVINAADVIAVVQEVVDQVAMVIRFISLFAILAGAVILASSVAGTRFRRVREVVIMKTLGARRGRLAGIFSVEFLVLGTVAGVMGSLLACGFSALLLKRLLDADFRFDALPNLVAILLTALVAIASGWLASFRILGQKPLEILRNE